MVPPGQKKPSICFVRRLTVLGGRCSGLRWGIFTATIDYIANNTISVDKGIQRGECPHCGADRLRPERDQHRAGARQAGSRRSCQKSMKS